MKVRMKVDLSGLRNGIPWPAPGEVVELPDGEATELCAAGIATPVARVQVETAQAPQEDVELREQPKRGKKTP